MTVKFLSACTVLTLLYGTDVLARDYVRDSYNDQEETDVDSSYEQRMKDSRIKKGHVKNLRKNFEEQEESEEEKSTDSNVKQKIKFWEQKTKENSEEIEFTKRPHKFEKGNFVKSRAKVFEQNENEDENSNENIVTEQSFLNDSEENTVDEKKSKKVSKKSKRKHRKRKAKRNAVKN